MTKERLAGLLLPFIVQDLLQRVSYESILKDFAKAGNRFWILNHSVLSSICSTMDCTLILWLYIFCVCTFVIEMVSDCISDTLTFNFFRGGGGGGGGGMPDPLQCWEQNSQHLVSLGMLGMYCPPPPVDFPLVLYYQRSIIMPQQSQTY